MVSFVIATHGTLAQGLENSIELIMGKQEGIQTLSILHETNIEQYGMDLLEIIEKTDDGSGVVVFTDILLASPYNQATSCYKKVKKPMNLRILSGVNLPMLLEAISSRMSNKDLSEICLDAEKAGKENITEFLSHMKKMNGGIPLKFDNLRNEEN